MCVYVMKPYLDRSIPQNASLLLHATVVKLTPFRLPPLGQKSPPFLMERSARVRRVPLIETSVRGTPPKYTHTDIHTQLKVLGPTETGEAIISGAEACNI